MYQSREQVKKGVEGHSSNLGNKKFSSIQKEKLIQPKERFGHKPTILYRPQVDGLRCLAILPVICFHYQLFNDYTSGGFGGVDVFFVISGFLVNSIIISDLLKEKFSLLIFYERRVRRLFPAIFLTLSVFLYSGYCLYFEKQRYQELVREETAALGNFANVYFYARRGEMGDGYFDDNTQNWPFLHFWSLAVEEQFYMMTPLALMLLIKFTKKFRFLKYMLIYSISSIVISLTLSIWLTETNQMFAFYLLPCRAWQLGLGGLIAIILHNEMIEKIKSFFEDHHISCSQRAVTIFLQIISWLGLLMILYSYAAFNKKDDLFPGYKALLPCCGVALFIAANFIRYDEKPSHLPLNSDCSDYQNSGYEENAAPKRIVLTSARVLSWRPIIFVGQISYSLYLWHWPVWVFFNYFMYGKQIMFVNKIFCAALTFTMAILSTNEIQNPIRNKKKVSTELLWRGFSVLWTGFMCLLFYNLIAQIGGIEVVDSFTTELKNNSDGNLYPKYDFQGYLLQNPYRSLKADEVSLKKMGIPAFTNNSLRYPYENITKGPIKGLEPILINYSEEDRKQNKRICLATFGSSHTEQHTETIRELALQYNISLAIISASATKMQFSTTNRQDWDQFRVTQFKNLRPRMIFAQNSWLQYIDNIHEQMYKNALDFLLTLPSPPEYIGFFGDNPFSGLSNYNKFDRARALLEKKYLENGKSWKFIESLMEPKLQDQIQLEEKIAKFLEENYNNGIVHFYPHLHQFMQDPETGAIQVVGSEVDGKLLYRDYNHLTVFGSRRYRNYFERKIFEKAIEICKE